MGADSLITCKRGQKLAAPALFLQILDEFSFVSRNMDLVGSLGFEPTKPTTGRCRLEKGMMDLNPFGY